MQVSENQGISRRRVLQGTGAAVAAGTLGLWGAPRASAATNGFGLSIVDHAVFGRMHYYRFDTGNIGWDPGVNVLLPDDYFSTSWRRYPVLYLLHGGLQDFRKFDMEDDIRGLTAGRRLIVVMPDGGGAGWYSNPVNSFAGPRNWESFHLGQLVPWIDANFRTFAEYDGRAVSGFSMGGFGALKYTAKYYGHFASVSSHSGPASLRRDGGLVVHWANTSSAFAELNGGTVYGAPFWNEGRVSADNPIERIESYRNKRIFLVCGLDGDVNETPVRDGQREFRDRLHAAGIPHEWHELPGAHFVRRDMLQRDVDGVIARLRKAG
ncbi:MAG: alpha/beta hydrolase-fold protein [Actinomycetota bacterium]|nr:alpha/beta hydrolase-fold protein [Actinomycetota bacterium]